MVLPPRQVPGNMASTFPPQPPVALVCQGVSLLSQAASAATLTASRGEEGVAFYIKVSVPWGTESPEQYSQWDDFRLPPHPQLKCCRPLPLGFPLHPISGLFFIR